MLRSNVAALFFLTWGLLSPMVPLRAQTAPPTLPQITLHYQERPPYSQLQPDGQQVEGLVATPAARAFIRAGVPFKWVRTPSQRQLTVIQRGEGMDCGIGWLRSTTRELSGKFTRELYRDQPTVALARADAPLRDGISLREAIERENAKLLLKESYSYGPDFDALLAVAKPGPARTSAENQDIVRMLIAGRSAWMLVSLEEAQFLISQPGIDRSALRVLRLTDVPPGEPRHVYCSNAVPDAVIERINRAIAAPG